MKTKDRAKALSVATGSSFEDLMGIVKKELGHLSYL